MGETVKIAVNRCHGGFGLSREAFLKLREMGNECALGEPDFGEYYSDGSGPRKSWGFGDSFCHEIKRDDPQLIEVIECMGSEASAQLANIEITEIPADVDWEIAEYDGREWVAERHRTW